MRTSGQASGLWIELLAISQACLQNIQKIMNKEIISVRGNTKAEEIKTNLHAMQGPRYNNCATLLCLIYL